MVEDNRCGSGLVIHGLLFPRLAPSLRISHSSKSDIHEIIMNPLDEYKKLLSREIQILLSAPHSGKKVIQSSYNTLHKMTW